MKICEAIDVPVLNESAIKRFFSRPLFHITHLEALKRIVKTDSIIGAPSIFEPPGIRFGERFISTSYNRKNNFARSFVLHTNKVSPLVYINFNRNIREFESVSVNFFYDNILDYSPNEGKTTALLVSEDEVRILPDRKGIRPASKYIKSIDVLVLDSDVDVLLPDLLFLQKRSKVPILCYRTIGDFYDGKKGVPLDKFLGRKDRPSSSSSSSVPLREDEPSFKAARKLIDVLVPIIKRNKLYKAKQTDISGLDIGFPSLQENVSVLISSYLRRAERSGYRLRKNDLELERLIRASGKSPIDFISSYIK